MYYSEPHRRFNPLRNSWVLCSPHRTQRPWQGAQESAQVEKRPEYDEKCYLCPGNVRANGEQNEKYDSTFIFENDFAAVKSVEEVSKADGPNVQANDDLFRAEQVTGRCYVICFNPRHDLTLAQMTYGEVSKVIDAWCEIYKLAQANKEVQYCQTFENKGSAMGCSNPHPHGQTWMTSIIPEEPAMEHENLLEYSKKHNGRGLLEDYIAKELTYHEAKDEANNRFVEINDSFIAVIPYWAVWPYEILVVSRRKVGNVNQLNAKEKEDFAHILRDVALRYDNLFQTSFPYSMGLHQSFVNSEEPDVEHLHVHFYPPLLRSATVKKFLVGFEMLGMPQRDITPESAAANLRKVDGRVHYTENLK